MDLLDIRTQFAKLSGRYDLVVDTTDYVDNGADFYINAGVRFLDRKFLVTKSVASVFAEVASGDWYLTFRNCSYIKEVWCNSASSRWKLTKYPYETIKNNYAELVSASDGGSPLFYTPIWLRSTDITDFQSLGIFFNYVKSDDDGTYNGIMFVPKADDAYNIEVVGKFSSAELTAEDGTNYWSVVAPEILIKAALYQLEVFNRNTEGAKDWLTALTLEAKDLEFDLVMEEGNEERVLD